MFRKRSTANRTATEDIALVPSKRSGADSEAKSTEVASQQAAASERGKRGRDVEDGDVSSPPSTDVVALVAPIANASEASVMAPRVDLSPSDVSVMAPRSDVATATATTVTSIPSAASFSTVVASENSGYTKPPSGVCGPYWKTGAPSTGCPGLALETSARGEMMRCE